MTTTKKWEVLFDGRNPTDAKGLAREVKTGELFAFDWSGGSPDHTDDGPCQIIASVVRGVVSEIVLAPRVSTGGDLVADVAVMNQGYRRRCAGGPLFARALARALDLPLVVVSHGVRFVEDRPDVGSAGRLAIEAVAALAESKEDEVKRLRARKRAIVEAMKGDLDRGVHAPREALEKAGNEIDEIDDRLQALAAGGL